MANIFELFQKLQDMDDELIEFTFDDHRDLLTDTQAKIDAYNEVRSRLTTEAAWYDTLAESYLVKSKKLEAQIERLDAYLIGACKAFGIKEFKGLKSKVRLVEQTRLRPSGEPGEAQFSKHPEYCLMNVLTQYKWDTSKLISDFKEGKESAKKLVEEYKSEYLRFSI